MTNQEIYELMSRFESSAICRMKVTSGDFSIELSKDGAVPAEAPARPAMAPAVPAPAAPAPHAEHAVKAPLAGVFYTAPEPGAKPFVSVGDKVRKGETVALMEAMKMISEIPAPCDCIITEILKSNGDLAAYDEPLMGYTPC